ncbi:MAG TPA: excinuclease ABC subunit A [Verrucomicrobiae bacterium]|nr:excinuclease ABC subunit A [Verrucomicrobiae bacterium]
MAKTRKDSKSPATAGEFISITGAREHNLKNLSLEIPRGKFVVVTGVSGSGKSTLAFDLLFAEGQRRFLDSMNTYARQFIEQMARPDVDLIAGLPPTVSIEQRTSRGGGKSTVATVTEIYQFIRLLFARLGTQYCPDCQVPVREQSADELSRHLLEETKTRGDLLLLAPVVRNRKGFHTDVAEWAAKHGYNEVRADGKMYPADKRLRLDRFKEHDVEVVIGVLEEVGKPMKSGRGSRRAQISLERQGSAGASPDQEKSPQQVIDEAIRIGGGVLFALDNRGHETVHSTHRVCPKCSRSFEPLDPKNFSYNSSQGWCPKCRGFGELFYIPEVERGANADSIEESWWRWANEREKCPECDGRRLNQLARSVRLDLTVDADVRRLTSKPKRSEPRHPDSSQLTIDFFADATVGEAGEWFRQLKPAGRAAEVARDIIPEINTRLHFLEEVGLGYLQLGRSVTTLSGGEAQRIRLAAQLGSNLSGVLYILDEPTIGLHPRDNEQLLAALKQLQRRGNSLVVVEHDEDTMRHADWIVDLGPGAGVKGGEVVAAGTLKQLLRHKNSLTGRTLAAQADKRYPTRGERRLVTKPSAERRGPKHNRKPKSDAQNRKSAPVVRHSEFLRLEDASTNNLKSVTIDFPLNRFVVVTGVSGSGKSTLIRECLLPALEHALKAGRGPGRAKLRLSPKVKSSQGSAGASPDHHAPRITHHELLKHVYEVDQSPIGRTPRSTPATYVGFFDDIRELFAQTPEARMRGYSASRFSFNSAQGRCPECQGAGTIKVEMNFLPTAHVKCETCNGLRFTPETLDVEYRGRNIAQVLELSVAEALEFFAAQSKIRRPLEALRDTGLDYLKIGQTSPTLSGGEAQRVKLVTHLLSGLKPAPDQIDSRVTHHASRQGSLFILEEPTIGLHMTDVQKLVEVIQRLVDAGHTVIVIEHNLDLIGEADWVIDLGPEGGDGGGRIVTQGTPEEVANCESSHTGRFLKGQLGITG